MGTREPVVEILAEAALLDGALQLAIGCRDHARVDLSVGGAADALELTLLQHAQELDLHLHGQVADLIENSVPPSASSSDPCAGRWRR